MARGRVGLIKAIKEIFREVKFFGDAEIATLRKELEAQKQQLERMRAAQQERQRREEELALLEMRKAVEHLQQMEGMIQHQDERLEAAVEHITERAQRRQEQDMTARAMRVVQEMDMEKLLLNDEAALREQVDQLRAKLAAELDAAGRGLPSPSAPPASGGGSAAKGGRR